MIQSILILIAINSLAWMIVHLSIAAIFLQIPTRFFRSPWPLDRVSRREAALYRNQLQIRRWKHLLPDGSRRLGGESHRQQPAGRDPITLSQFLIATRRAEAAHWLMLAFCPIFFFWNPPAVWPVLVLYAVAANLPCIIVQRYNRFILMRILKHLPR